MDWFIRGAYLAACTCTADEHWPIPSGAKAPHESCRGVTVFRIEEGSADGVDLASVDFAVATFFPQFPATLADTEEREVGVILDADASDEQSQRVEALTSLDQGGAFGHLLHDESNDVGTERASFSVAKGASPIVKIEGSVAFRFEPTLDDAGAPIRGGKAMFAFGTDRIAGKTQGPPAMIFGQVFTPHYGEYARFDIRNAG